MSRPRLSPLSFACAGCGRALTLPRLMAGGMNRCPHCRRWMFTPSAPVSERDLGRARGDVETVADGLATITRTPTPAARDAESTTRQAADLLAAAITSRDDYRLADAVVTAEKANRLLAEALKATDGLLANLRTRLQNLQAFTAPA
jgi:DNA-directed RNA polymerase subunit RPC12/RpoP